MIVRMSKMEFDSVRAFVLKLTHNRAYANHVARGIYMDRLERDIQSVLEIEEPPCRHNKLTS